MVEGFVPLARSLRAQSPRSRSTSKAVTETSDSAATSAALEADAECERPRHRDSRAQPPRPSESQSSASELALLAHMRLAALEAFARAAARLLEGLAHDVLGRELLLAPADVEALVARAHSAFATRGPVAVDVSPADAAAAERVGLPLRIDPALGPGDIVVRVRDGSFESPLAFRLASVLTDASAEA